MKVSGITQEFVPTQSVDAARTPSEHYSGSCEMCFDTMDSNSTHISTNCSTKHKFVSKMKWKMLRTRTTEDTFKMLHKTVKAAAARRCVHKGKPSTPRPGKGLRPVVEEEGGHRRPMAPENTTQYLMARVYADMSSPLGDSFSPRSVYDTTVDVYGESLSPTSVSTALDSIYDDYLAFQQRDFEEVFGL